MNTLKVITKTQLEGRSRSVVPSCKLYVNESVLDSMIDDWFDKNKIWSLKFKCKTWGQVKRKVTKIQNDIICKHVGEDGVKSTYSRNCGCSCGCSPGYRVSNVLPEFSYNQVSVNFSFDDNVIEDVKEFLKQKTVALEKELKSHNIS